MAGVLVASSVYIVDVRERALDPAFAEVVTVRENPGLGIKVLLLDLVVKYDARILVADQPDGGDALDDRRLVVDAFARWQVVDAQRVYQASQGVGLPFVQKRLVTPSTTPSVRCWAGPLDHGAVG